jgi:hypothetical protein
MQKIISKMQDNWLQKTWKNKTKKLAGLYLAAKPDGVRFRPIGTYAGCPHRILLGYAAIAWLNVLKFSGTKNFAIYKTSDLKQIVADFEELATNANLKISKTGFDIESFYSAVQQKHLIPRLEYFKEKYIKRNHTNRITIPKHKNDKKTKPHTGSSKAHNTISFHIDTLIGIARFATENAYFNIGNYVLKQEGGLSMGDPLSSPMALLYVAYDEHLFIMNKSIQRELNTDIIHILIRFADDILALYATNAQDIERAKTYIHKLITENIYEHDIDEKSLKIIEDEKSKNKYLDANVIIYNDKHNVKLTYHNKNKSIMKTDHQEVGRLHNANSPVPINIKINACATTLARIHDCTTIETDMIKPAIEILYEMKLLGYNYRHMHSALTKANRIRKTKFNTWETITKIAQLTFET